VSLEFRARCPKCDNRAFEEPQSLDVSSEIECSACGHRGKLVEFADLATLDAIVDDLKRRTLGALRNGHGLKAGM
jgi:predicted nucleic-acid-binding Zn-ribbon protein